MDNNLSLSGNRCFSRQKSTEKGPTSQEIAEKSTIPRHSILHSDIRIQEKCNYNKKLKKYALATNLEKIVLHKKIHYFNISSYKQV